MLARMLAQRLTQCLAQHRLSRWGPVMNRMSVVMPATLATAFSKLE
ncbi:hypothetical protein [Rhabdochromatium marinum]|nr:hypothetical protein [Rhabdochromatium marinum]